MIQNLEYTFTMHGLKLNIILTIILLLATGMLLTDVIITAFWQLSIANTFAALKKSELAAIAAASGNNIDFYTRYLQGISEEKAHLCGAILLRETWQTVPASCGQTEELRSAIAQAQAEGKAVTSKSGSTPGVFFPRSKFLHIAVPLEVNRGAAGAIGITYPLPPIWLLLQQHQQIILVYILFNTIVLTVIGFFRIASFTIRPIDRLIEKASNYTGEQDLGLASASEGSEFRQLSSAIHRMVRKIDRDKIQLQETVRSLKQANETIQKNQQEMVRAEKLASVGRLSAGLAHEIGNPLGIIFGYLGLLRQDRITQEERLEYIERSEQELNRINALVRQLLDFSRPLPVTGKPVSVHALLLDLQEMLLTQKKNHDVSFTNSLKAEHDVVPGDKETLRQAFLNFYLNALDALHETDLPEQATILTESELIQDGPQRTMLRVTITDNGTGIPAAQLKNIFDPFFTTKDPGKGTGLGLSVSHAIIENFGGGVRAMSAEGQGTSIIVELPTAPGQNGDQP